MKVKDAGRAYIIRYYDERTDKAFFYGKANSYSREMNLTPNIKNAEIFLDHAEATKRIISLKKEKKRSEKGYWYISKIFYKEEYYGFNKTNVRRTAIKLTKPDRHDFLNAI